MEPIEIGRVIGVFLRYIIVFYLGYKLITWAKNKKNKSDRNLSNSTR